ncbi:MAG: DUF2974 domain-containing protein [Lachnospiraceae bacterium]|jgi:hypothetical protein|nr:DUF2974 domain-containing protein [Lachnospiraceae bacterium]
MYETIITYCEKYGNKDFEELPFNEVDSLCLCQLSYMKIDSIVPSPDEPHAFVRLSDIYAHPEFDKLFMDPRFANNNRELFLAMMNGKRFNTMRISLHVDLIVESAETQFSAVTYKLSNGDHYVCYRGTDETFVGWKEDFNMAFSRIVPCQASAKDYLKLAVSRFDGNFYIGGHSKGGNLAVYAAMTSDKKIRDRIIKVYDHDGPGFRQDILESFDAEGITEKIQKTMPHDAIVGMLFQNPKQEYEVVESRGLNIQQHDPYNWRVDGTKFYKVKDIFKTRQFADGTVNRWILAMDDEQKYNFVEALYSIIEGSEAKTLLAFTKHLKKSLEGCFKAFKNMDDKTKNVLKETVDILIEAGKENLKDNVDELKGTIQEDVETLKKELKK